MQSRARSGHEQITECNFSLTDFETVEVRSDDILCGFQGCNLPPVHSVLEEPDYVDVWTARHRAILLESSLTCHFLSSHLDFLFFEPFINDTEYPVPHEDLRALGIEAFVKETPSNPDEATDCYAGYHGGDPKEHRPDPQEVPNLMDPPVDTDGSSTEGHQRRDTRRPLRHFPSWVTDLWQLLQDEGAVELLEEGPIVYLGSYYISHETCVHQHEQRPVRLDQHYDQWAQTIMDVWQDRFDHLSGFEVHLVLPEPPISITQGIVGTILVTQHPMRGNAAILTTVVYDEPHGPRIDESAHSLRMWIRPADILQHAGASIACHELTRHGFGPCTIRIGRRDLHNNRIIRIHDGIGLVIRVPMMVDDATWENIAIQRIRENFETAPHHFEEDEQVAMMARRPRPRSTSSQSSMTSPSSSRSCTLSEDEWKRTVVFSLDGQVESVLLPWNNADELHLRVAHAFDLVVQDIQNVFYVTDRPEDLMRYDLQCLLIQRSNDVRPAENMRLTLLDTDIFVDQDVLPSAFRRHAHWTPATVTRVTFIRLLGLEALCNQHVDKCQFWHNNRLIPNDQVDALTIENGDYLKIFIGTEDQRACMPFDSDTNSHLQVHSSTDHKVAEGHVQQHSPDFCVSTTRTRMRRRRQRTDADEDAERLPQLQALWERPQRRSTGLQNEPVMIFDTWYLSSMNFPRCSIPRIVALPSDVTLWPTRLTQVWRDRVHPHWPIQIVHVTPDPSDTTQGGHLLLLQHSHPEEAGVLLSQYQGIAARTPHDRFAQMAPQQMSFERFLWLHDQERLCAQSHITCDGFHGQVRFRPQDLWRTNDGQHLELYVHPIDQTDDDITQLMQQPAERRTSESSMSATHSGMPPHQHPTEGQPSTSTVCPAFQFNADAAIFTPAQQPLHLMPGEIQELHQAWTTTAFSWEQEPKSSTFAVWFVDHTRNWPHGRHFRTTQLPEDFMQWERIIYNTWNDYIVPGAPLEFTLVSPKPWTRDANVAGHIIVIQNAIEQLVTSLVTIHEPDEAPTRPHQRAITTSEHIYLEDLLRVLELFDSCFGPTPTHRCQAWYERLQLQPQVPIMGRSGYGIVMHIHAGIPPPVRAAPVLLQLSTRLIARADDKDSSERLTTDTVTQGQWPLDPVQLFLPIGTHVPQDWKQDDKDVVVKIMQQPLPHPTLPAFVELPEIFSEKDAAQELQKWGHDCQVFLCGEHDVIFALPHGEPIDDHLYVYCGHDVKTPASVFTRSTDQPQSEHGHMRFLYGKGFTKAVLLGLEQWRDNLQCVHFADIQPQHELPHISRRSRTPWPCRQPTQWDTSRPIQLPPSNDEPPACLLSLECGEIKNFLELDDRVLFQDHAALDLPEFIKDALNACGPIERIDRYVIFTDGSSQTRHKHRPPEWVAEHDVSDSWAFVVLGEQYSDEPGQPSQLQFLGCHCQQVLYESEAPHHIGTTKVGSDAAETEGLFWAGLWRIARNERTPTVFVCDSRLIGDQAAGRAGSTQVDAPFRHLRAVYQTLEASLPGDLLKIEHVRSHTGDPFNELADWLAKKEGQKSFFIPRQQVHMPTFGHILDTLWMTVGGQQDLPPLRAQGFDLGQVELPSKNHVANTATLRHKPEIRTTQFALGCATANVRTFYRGNGGHSGKLAYVREQFAAHHLNCIGLQETRTDPGSSFQHQVLRIAGGCDRGQLGMELWINLAQPFAWQGRTPLFFQRHDFVVVDANPRRLLVHALNAHIDLWLLVAHAPHSGADQTLREDWWRSMTELTQAHVSRNNLIVMIDANATSGHCDGQHIFDQDDAPSANTPLLREFMETLDLFAPATTQIHSGDHFTWTSPLDDSLHRIDFVLLPRSWSPWCTWSEGLESLDFGHLGDHRATAVAVNWTASTVVNAPDRHRMTHQREDIKFENLHSVIEQYQPCGWHTDIERQVDHLNDFLLHSLHEQCPPRTQGPKKTHITPDIWQLRLHKIRLQRRHRDQQRRSRQELLAQVFQSWRRGHGDPQDDLHYNYKTSILTSKLKVGVELRQVAHKLRSRLQRARQMAVYSSIESLQPDCAASQILHTLKPIIGTTNPKLRKSSPLPQVLDAAGHVCTTPEALRDRWLEFFSIMEGGERMSMSDLREQWIAQLEGFMQQQFDLAPQDIPTLTDLENAFRRVRPRKAVGEDGIPPELCHQCPKILARVVYGQLLKLCSHGQEALLHKGGVLIAAWKRKGSQQQCESYRSLLISSHIAKSVHRAVRDHQANTYEAFLQSEQIGGRRSIPVSLGVHFIRAAARRARSARQSHALIFLDLREAFYRVLRPLSIGGCMPDSLLAQVAARLHLPEDALADLHELLRAPAGTECAQMKPHMRRALQALHTNTHFSMKGHEDRVHTRIGSRPGDPFADVVFGYMFARILLAVEDRLAQAGVLDFVEDYGDKSLFPKDSHGPIQRHTMMGPTWMDDLCLTITGSSATAVETRAGVAASILLEICTVHGVTPNLDRGKSEILFTFRGQGARHLRTKYFGQSQDNKMTIITEYGSYQITTVGQYTHLGNMAHHSGTSHKEVRKRVGVGNAAFTAHRRILFQNPAFSLRRRSELFTVLVHSKIAYGMESWVFEDKRTWQYFHSATLRLYRRLLKIAPDSKVTDDEILERVHLLTPENMLRIHRLRYLGLLYKCEQVTPWAMLRQDRDWCALLAQDLQWMWKLVERTSRLRDPASHFEDWEYVLRYHRSYWKTLLQRCQELTIRQHQDHILIRKLHRDAFHQLQQHGAFRTAPVRPHLDPAQQEAHYGCMMCQKRCRNRAGEGAHLFRMHGIVARERHWISTTSCDVCLREYHTFDKLQVHLRNATHCRQVLNARPTVTQFQPGFGSTANSHLRDQHNGLLPVQQAAGPQISAQPRRDIDSHHLPLFEQLALDIVEFNTHSSEELYTTMKETIQSHPVGWTITKTTLYHLADSLTEEFLMDVPICKDQILGAIWKLCDVHSWSFLCEVEHDIADGEHLYNLDLYEQWCDDLAGLEHAWTRFERCPRQFYQERVILHAYSGRRRQGDVQWYLDRIAKEKNMDGVLVISLDIVIDSTLGDISRPEVQEYWLNAMREGMVIGMLSGPPCCTWSVARGKTDSSMQLKQGTGPRVIRNVEELWGMTSVSLRELLQLHDGHVLLGFSILGMIMLHSSDGFGVLEHPGEPDDPHAASIWRLPIIKMLLNLPGFDLFECSQGLLGAASRKRTGLLTLRIPSLPIYLRNNALCADIPKAQTIGVDAEGRFRTAKLKEYPPALCKALAESFADSFPPISVEDLSPLPPDFKQCCLRLHSTDMGTTIGADCVAERA